MKPLGLILCALLLSSVCFAEPLIIGVTDVEHGKSELAKMQIQPHRVLKHSWAIAVTGDREKFEKLPWVRYVEPDPSDAMRVHEDTLDWGVNKIDGDVFWGGTQGAVNVTGMAGAGVTVAVVDTGIDCSHPDLAVNCINGPSFSGSATSFDDYGHGTHVAGTIGARDNGIGYIGVAPEATLVAVKVLSSSGSGSLSSVAAGIEWAIDNGANVINMSLGGSHSDTVCAAVKAAWDAGIFVATSAGNSGCCETIGSPADCLGATAIGATDNNDNLAAFSSTGKALWVSAPGVSVWSTVPTSTCKLCSPTGYKALSGTSMASPHVAGAAALLMGQGFDNEQVRNKLANGSVELGAAGWDMFHGYGRINVMDALSAWDTQPPGPTDTTPPTDLVITSPVAGTVITSESLVRFSGTASDESEPVWLTAYRGSMVNSVRWLYFLCDFASGSYCSVGMTEAMNGTDELWVKATDAVGNKTWTSEPFTVAIAPPVCSPLSETRIVACPKGYHGAITEERTSICPGPTWGPWVEIENTCVKNGRKR